MAWGVRLDRSLNGGGGGGGGGVGGPRCVNAALKTTVAPFAKIVWAYWMSLCYPG